MRKVIERAKQRSTGGRTRGQLCRITRSRGGEIGSIAEEPQQPILRPGAQLVGERARWGHGHPRNATRVPGIPTETTGVDMTATDLKSYRPGSWFGIFGSHATLLLPPSERGRVAALWALVDDGADFGEVLDALIASGLRDLPGFVLVADVDGSTTVVLRGPARAVFTTADGESIEVDGAAVSTWVERTLTDVQSMRVSLEDPDEDGHEFTIIAGLVRVGWVGAPAGARLTAEPGHEELVTEALAMGETPRDPPAEEADQDHDGMTRAGAQDPSQSARQQPGIPGQPASAQRHRATGGPSRVLQRRDHRGRQGHPGRPCPRSPQVIVRRPATPRDGAEPPPGDLVDASRDPTWVGSRPRLRDRHRPGVDQRHRARTARPGPRGAAARHSRPADPGRHRGPR